MNDEEKLSKESLILLIIHDFNYEQQEEFQNLKKMKNFKNIMKDQKKNYIV